MANAGATSSLLAHAAAATSTAPACPYSTLFFKSARKSTAAAGPCHGGRRHHRRAMTTTCRAGGDNEEGLLWLPRRDVLLTGLTGVAAGLTTYPGLASTPPTLPAPAEPCPSGEKVDDKVVTCKDSGIPCPRPSIDPEKIVGFDKLPQHKGTPRIRKPAHLLTCEEQNVYRKAVSLMKSLPADHPLSFDAQAAIHEAYCDGHYQYRSDNKDRPFDVHFSWIFAPWHRMYIYFYERALRALLKQDKDFAKYANGFALPYWNWDHPSGMVVPPIFRDGGSADKNSLYDANRNLTLIDKLVDLNYDFTSPGEILTFDESSKCDQYKKLVYCNLALINQQQIRTGKGAQAFLGDKLCTAAIDKVQALTDKDARRNEKTKAQGTLERMAHTALHLWVGKNGPRDEKLCEADASHVMGHDGKPKCSNDMGFLGTASRDPLFYSHHSNVDRLWHIWCTKLGGKGFDDDQEWLDTSFVFYDGVEDPQNPQPVRIKISDVLDAKKLGYTYYDDDVKKKDLPWSECALQTLVPHGKDAAPRAKTRTGPVNYPLKLVKGTPVEVPDVALPRTDPGKRRVLIIDGIVYDPAANNKFDVAINVPKDKAGMVGPTCIEYAGSFSIVPSSKDGGGTLQGKVAFVIDDMLKDTRCAGDKDVDVVLVPRTDADIKLTVAPVVKNFDLD